MNWEPAAEERRGAADPEQSEDEGIRLAAAQEAKQDIQCSRPQAADHTRYQQHQLVPRLIDGTVSDGIHRDEGEQREEGMHRCPIVIGVDPGHV